MSSILGSIQESAQNVDTTEMDSVGRSLLNSDVYDYEIKMMYLDAAQSGAKFARVEFALSLEGNDAGTHTETVYFSNKAGELTYKDKQSGEAKALPGFVTIDSLCKTAVQKQFVKQSTEEKQIKVWDGGEEKVLPKEVVTSMLGAKGKVAIKRIVKNKQAKNDTGKYVDTAETMTINEMDKTFTADGYTVNELVANHALTQKGEDAKPATFINTWIEKFQGKEINQVKKVSDAQAGSISGATGGSEAKSLF